MNRIEIEVALHRDRIATLEAFGALSPEEMTSPGTRSEHDAEVWWTPKDHFSHMLRVAPRCSNRTPDESLSLVMMCSRRLGPTGIDR